MLVDACGAYVDITICRFDRTESLLEHCRLRLRLQFASLEKAIIIHRLSFVFALNLEGTVIREGLED